MAFLKRSMIECSNCGNQLGHLHSMYYKYGKAFTAWYTTADSLREFASSNTTYIVDTEEPRRDIAEWLKTYCSWLADHMNPDDPLPYTSYNLVARALLAYTPLDVEELPFGSRAKTGRSDLTEAKYCCLRMFMCDPTNVSI